MEGQRLLVALFASTLLLTSIQGTAPGSQDPVTVEDVDIVDDVEVIGRRFEEIARDFIDDVAAPPRRRGLARWNGPLCVGTVNLRADTAQPIIDRISEVARDLDINVGEPGCNANTLIVATDDGAALATALAERRRRLLHPGSLKTIASSRAFELFQTSSRPVRWWQISVPVDSTTGQIAIRLPGVFGPDGQPHIPVINVLAASRIRSQIRDDLTKVFIIVDVDEVDGLTITQLADYLAMVTLAQIDGDAETSAYDTVLNLFQDREGTSGLTEWDRAYLAGLYSAEQNRINLNAQARNVADAAVRARRANSDQD